jgi:hypothetical protein
MNLRKDHFIQKRRKTSKYVTNGRENGHAITYNKHEVKTSTFQRKALCPTQYSKGRTIRCEIL